jgi:chromosome segregation ATPase
MNHNLENELTQEILYLQNELRNSGQQHVKANHDSIIIESLKADLAEAHRLKDESVSAVQADFDTLKKECDKSITYYRNTIETLRSELHDTKTRADADCKYWMHNFQPRLISVKEENRTLVQQLTEAKMEVDQLRNVESELEILQQAKVQTESELKNTQLQLDTAIRNLNEMALDGSKMRNDLEGFLNALKKEKNQYQKEIDRMNKVSEEQQTQIRNLMIENERYDVDCKELRIKVSDSIQLKDELNMKLRTLTLENEQYERLRSELQQNVALLNKKLEQEKSISECHIKEMRVIEEQYKKCNSARGSTDAKQLVLSECMEKMVQLEAENSRLSTHIAQHSRATEQLRHTHQEMSQKLSQKNTRYEHECNKLRELITSLEERLAQEKEESHQVRQEVVALRDQCQTLLLDKATHEALQRKLSESTAIIKQLDKDRKELSAQLAQKHEMSAELSHAKQTIEVLKSKERYLESRVDSLANQISKTVQDYEMKLCDFSRSSSCENDD